MKLRADQLNGHLQQGLKTFYLVSGDEPLLVQEACDEIRAAARQQGFDERELFHAEAGFDWAQLREEANAMSLFASRRILEVRLPNGKPSDKGDTFLQLVANPNPDNLILLVCPRLDSKVQATKWFKAVEKAGIFLQIWPIERNQYPGWLKRKLQATGLQADPAALALLAHQTEGNLLAAVQEIEKLRLLGESHLTEELIQNAIHDSAKFDAFGFTDMCISGQLAESARILEHLKAEGVEVLMILGALNRKLRQLIALHGLTGSALAEAFKKERIWPKQQSAYKKALQRLSHSQLHEALQLSGQIDLAAKGSGDDPWLLLSEMCVVLSNVSLAMPTASRS